MHLMALNYKNLTLYHLYDMLMSKLGGGICSLDGGGRREDGQVFECQDHSVRNYARSRICPMLKLTNSPSMVS